MQRTARTSRIAAAAAAVALSTLLIPSAVAGCGGSAGRILPSVRTAPELPRVTSVPAAQDDTEAAITGLWKTVFTSGGAVVGVGFDTFHSDGTELANDGFPTILGNVCAGTWEKTGPRTYTTVHPTFNYDQSGFNVIGIFIERVHVTLSPDGNSFAGTFNWDNYDFQGNLLPGSLTGTLTGTRLAVGKPFPFPFPF